VYKVNGTLTPLILFSFTPFLNFVYHNFRANHPLYLVDYGEKENADLAERFGIKTDDFPEYRLFIKGQGSPISFQGDEAKADEIKRFVVKETGSFTI